MFEFSFRFVGGGNPFSNLEKTAVLQETRTFNETPVNARKCTHILTKILYLINQVLLTGQIFELHPNDKTNFTGGTACVA